MCSILCCHCTLLHYLILWFLTVAISRVYFPLILCAMVILAKPRLLLLPAFELDMTALRLLRVPSSHSENLVARFSMISAFAPMRILKCKVSQHLTS